MISNPDHQGWTGGWTEGRGGSGDLLEALAQRLVDVRLVHVEEAVGQRVGEQAHAQRARVAHHRRRHALGVGREHLRVRARDRGQDRGRGRGRDRDRAHGRGLRQGQGEDEGEGQGQVKVKVKVRVRVGGAPS